MDLALKEGEGALLTGPNGSGKSTLLRLMAGLSKPSGGAVRSRPGAAIAYLGHASFLYPGLTAIENLAFWLKAASGHADRKKLEEGLDLAGLSAHADEPCRNFSKGMAQRLNFARVFLADARIFLLDEPFSGVDRASRQIIMAELERRKRAGAAIFMASHDLEHDAPLAGKIYLLEKKRLRRAPESAGGAA